LESEAESRSLIEEGATLMGAGLPIGESFAVRDCGEGSNAAM
jgi:hypothetical protein